jgi:hypothetical protein
LVDVIKAVSVAVLKLYPSDFLPAVVSEKNVPALLLNCGVNTYDSGDSIDLSTGGFLLYGTLSDGKTGRSFLQPNVDRIIASEGKNCVVMHFSGELYIWLRKTDYNFEKSLKHLLKIDNIAQKASLAIEFQTGDLLAQRKSKASRSSLRFFSN